MNTTQNKNVLTPKGFIKGISIFHFALFVGQIFFAIFAYTQNGDTKVKFTNTDADDQFIYVIPIIIITGVFASNFIYKKLLTSILNKTSLKEKLTNLQTALLIKYALIEGPTLLVIFIYMNYGNLFYLLIAGGLLVYFYMLKPTKEKIENDLQLNNEHKSEFNRPDQIIE